MYQDIFISYSRKDIQQAKRIKAEIEERTSLKCWMDMDGIESGSQFEDVIISAIDNANVILFLLSENSMHSKWTKDEVRYAYETGKKVVPVNIDGCTPRGWFLFRFSGRDIIDYSVQDQRNKLMEDLAEWGNKGKPITGNGSSNNDDTVKKDKLSTIIFNTSLVVQALLFGGILASLFSMFFFGFLTMSEGIWARNFNMLLCACLFGTLYCTYLLFKKKKIAFYILCVLDIVEILLICAVAQRIRGYGLKINHTYHLFPYVNLNGLGIEIYSKGFAIVAFLMELFAFFHIAVMAFVLFTKIQGKRIWDNMR